MSKPKTVLAYSGGLDTSYCVAWLTEQGEEVHALTVNTGGFTEDDLKAMEAQAFQLGAASFQAIDATRSFYEQCIRYLIFGNVLRNNTYPLSVSAERMFQALEVVRYAQEIGASKVAHGSTGAGNDQVRFDLVFQVLGQDLEILTPIRDQKLSRVEEIKYLNQKGFPWTKEKGQYSINQGIWGTSVGGAETLTSHQALPEQAFPSQLSAETPKDISLRFEKGELIGINSQVFTHPVEAIQALQAVGAPYAIGRDTHIGDTIIGIKGRVGFEAAAPLLILKAHHLLEKHVLTKWQQYWKDQLANWYGMLLHEGQFLEPVLRNIEVFMLDTQQPVSGKVFVQLLPYRFVLQGIESEFDLMNAGFGKYGEENTGWSGDDVKGFTKILGLQNKIYQAVHTEKSNT